MLDLNRFFARSPALYHMADADAWPHIERHGLLSTCELLRRCKTGDVEKADIGRRRKHGSVRLSNPDFGCAMLRDQSPLNDSKLKGVLEGVTVEEWISLLDCRVFFWAQRTSLDGLLKAKRYRDHAQVVITVDTKTFFNAYRNKIEVADINTGSVLYKPTGRGAHTFQKIASYTRKGRREITEVTVPNESLDLKLLSPRVVRREADGTERLLQ